MLFGDALITFTVARMGWIRSECISRRVSLWFAKGHKLHLLSHARDHFAMEARGGRSTRRQL
eukprot:3280045-Rhodomonas_salina.3